MGWDTAALTALSILVGLDALTTIYGVTSGKAGEANPVQRWLIAQLGVYPAILVFHGMGIATLWYFGPWPTWVVAVLCALFGAVVVNNIRVLRVAK